MSAPVPMVGDVESWVVEEIESVCPEDELGVSP